MKTSRKRLVLTEVDKQFICKLKVTKRQDLKVVDAKLLLSTGIWRCLVNSTYSTFDLRPRLFILFYFQFVCIDVMIIALIEKPIDMNAIWGALKKNDVASRKKSSDRLDKAKGKDTVPNIPTSGQP